MSIETLESSEPQSPARVPALIPDQTEIDETALPLIKAADAITAINTQAEYEAADNLVGQLNKARNGVKALVEKFFKKHKENARKTWQDMIDDEKNYIALHDSPLAVARDQKLALMNDYVERIKAENARLLREAQEREKKDQDARDRQEILAAAQAGAHLGYSVEIVNGDGLGLIRCITITNKTGQVKQVQKAELLQIIQAAISRDAEEKRLKAIEEERLAKADQLIAEGKTGEAEKILEAPIPPPPPVTVIPVTGPIFDAPRQAAFVPTFAVPTSRSVGQRKNWTWEAEGETDDERLASFAKLVKAAGENPALLTYLSYNDKALTAIAKSNENQARVPGIRFFNDPINANKRSK